MSIFFHNAEKRPPESTVFAVAASFYGLGFIGVAYNFIYLGGVEGLRNGEALFMVPSLAGASALVGIANDWLGSLPKAPEPKPEPQPDGIAAVVPTQGRVTVQLMSGKVVTYEHAAACSCGDELHIDTVLNGENTRYVMPLSCVARWSHAGA